MVRWPSEAVDRQPVPTASEGHRTKPLLTNRLLLAQRVPKLELGNQRPAGTSRLLPQNP